MELQDEQDILRELRSATPRLPQIGSDDTSSVGSTQTPSMEESTIGSIRTPSYKMTSNFGYMRGKRFCRHDILPSSKPPSLPSSKPNSEKRSIRTNSEKHTSHTPTNMSDDSLTMSPFKLSFLSSAKSRVTVPSPPPQSVLNKMWVPPFSSRTEYEDIKEKLLQGKFKRELTDYFHLDSPSRVEFIEGKKSEDEEYDTDLEINLGSQLISEEKYRELKKFGQYPEYKQYCAQHNSVPNSKFMKHSLDDDIAIPHRCMNSVDTKAVALQIKNHLSTCTLNLEDNGIDAEGMRGISAMLRFNKCMTVLNLSNNCLGEVGARLLRDGMLDNGTLVRLDVTGNGFGEEGGKYCAEIIEDNVNLKEFILARNGIGSKGAIHISQALVNNVSLRILDLSWNHIRGTGAKKLAESVAKNTELEELNVSSNGFGDEGGTAMIYSICKNTALLKLDLSANRISDTVLDILKNNLNRIKVLKTLKIGENIISCQMAFDLLSSLMTSISSICQIGLEGVEITEEIQTIRNALKIVQNVQLTIETPPSKREKAQDPLTRGLAALAEFLASKDVEDIQEIFPDYDDEIEDAMITTDDVIRQFRVIKPERSSEELFRLRKRLNKKCRRRRFYISELDLVLQKVLEGNDPLKEAQVRTHLRRSIRQERLEKERMMNTKKPGFRPIIKTRKTEE